jgi:hypothetical protein
MARLPLAACGILVSLVAPSSAHAQWYLGGYIGASHTQNATVSIRQPDIGVALDFHDVHFYSLSMQPRRYYGVRLGRMGWRGGRLGLEFEIIHMKAYGDTTRDYRVTSSGPITVETSPMNRYVQEFSMSHGLNYGLVNLVVRQPLGQDSSRAAIMLRGGGGPIVPHAESIVNEEVVHEYQYAGFGAQAAVGLDLRLAYRTSALAEYKVTYSRPELEIARGVGTTTAVSHHVSVGVTLALSSPR